MKRREFLSTPALGVLLPAGILDFLPAQPAVDQQTTGTPAQQTMGSPGPAGPGQRMHSDYVTFVKGIEYFHLGNGEISAVVQHSPENPEASFFGFTIWDTEIFSRKWTTFLYHPEQGFKNTRVGITLNETPAGTERKEGVYRGVTGFSLTRENLKSIAWERVDGSPMVVVRWTAGACEVREEFFVPERGAMLFRRVNVTNRGAQSMDALVRISLYANFGLFDRIATDPKDTTAGAVGLARMKLLALTDKAMVAGRYDVLAPLSGIQPSATGSCTFVYTIKGAESALKGKRSTIRAVPSPSLARKSFTCDHPVVDHLFDVSRSGLRSAVSRSGRLDGGTWMYNMEWLFDQVLASEALLRCGWVDEARVMLERNVRENIGPDGRAAESSRWYGDDYTELNHSGTLLYGVWNYLCWTGETAFIKKQWPRIRLCGDFPLSEKFLDMQCAMVHNKREFWERDDVHGMEDGYELGYQFWVVFGLQKGAQVARLVGDKATAERWEAVSGSMQNGMLMHPRFRLIEDGHLIKRRTLIGDWQRYCLPVDRNRMPPGSPLALNDRPEMEPDTTEVFPIAYEMIDPKGELSKTTLAWVERLWNQRWDFGGYSRYNTDSEPDLPGPWPLCSAIVAQAYLEAGDDEKVWRILNWLNAVHGGRSGGWFERYARASRPPRRRSAWCRGSGTK